MSRIDDLIAEHCPDGVNVVKLEDIIIIKHGKDYKKLNAGDIPVYGSGGIMTYVDQYAYDKPTVLIPRKGTLTNLFYLETPFWNVDTIFYTEIDDSRIIPKFFYYFMRTIDLMSFDTGSGRPSLTMQILNRMKIPVPPLEIQKEIVDILDAFTKLEAELEAELEARRQQYAYYRNALLSFNEIGRNVERERAVSSNGDHSEK
jgi:type I restriction enzyme S subunit